MRKIVFFIALTAVVLAFYIGSGKAQSTQVFIQPTSSTIAPGQAVTVEVRIRDVVNLYGVDFSLSFDSAVLLVEDANPTSPGVQITPGEFMNPAQLFVARNEAVNASGVITYTVVLQNPAPPVSGGGVLARITFRARGGGSSAVVFTRVLLGNDRAESIVTTVSGGTIVVSGATATPAPTQTATSSPMPTKTATGVPSPTATPAIEERTLGDAVHSLGWPVEAVRQPPLFKIQYVPAAGHWAEAWMQRYDRAGDAHAAWLQQRDTLAMGGWNVQELPFHGHSAYQASHSLNSFSETLPLNERMFVFQGAEYIVGASAFDDTSYLVAPDPQVVAEAVYQAGRHYYLFGEMVPGLFLPLLLRGHPPMPTPTPSLTPGLTPTMSETPWSTPSPTGSQTPEPTPSLTPTASETPLFTPSPTASPLSTNTATHTSTPRATPSATPGGHYTQLIVNPSFETDQAWYILPTEHAYLASYSVSRAHSGMRSMHLGIDTGYNVLSYSSVQQAVSIPGGVALADLSFYYFPVSTQADGDYIYFYVFRASDNAVLQSHSWTDQHQAWNLRSFDLRAFAGQRVILRFGVKNDGLGGVTAVYLDDVELRVVGGE